VKSSREFLEQTSYDYCMDIEIVKRANEMAKTSIEFYEELESELKFRRKTEL